jgi:hypothetical protein
VYYQAERKAHLAFRLLHTFVQHLRARAYGLLDTKVAQVGYLRFFSLSQYVMPARFPFSQTVN